MGELKFSICNDPKEWYTIGMELWENSIDPPVFYHPSMLGVMNSIKENIQMAILFHNGMPVLALPIYCEKKVRNVSYDGWDNLGLLKRKDVSADLIRSFWQKLLSATKRIKLENFSEADSKDVLNNSEYKLFVSRRKCPFFEIKDSWEELSPLLSKKLVRNVRQYGNKAERANISFEIKMAHEVSNSTLDQNLDGAYKFHTSRMEIIGQKSKFTPDAYKEYHKKVLESCDNVFTIEAKENNDKLIAFYYGFCNNKRLSWFNGGFDMAYRNLSIGTLLISNLLKWAYEHNLNYFDFLRGREDYKLKWTSDFNLNYDLYLCKKNPIYILRTISFFLAENRKRVGFKNALRLMAKGYRL
ncbi:MAG: GNAT family N-acetyltransferase [Schleiferiaceae bacterium]|nr:GNAT family N-acetyltransferase [Schleiferiaceae bacterium]